MSGLVREGAVVVVGPSVPLETVVVGLVTALVVVAEVIIGVVVVPAVVGAVVVPVVIEGEIVPPVVVVGETVVEVAATVVVSLMDEGTDDVVTA